MAHKRDSLVLRTKTSSKFSSDLENEIYLMDWEDDDDDEVEDYQPLSKIPSIETDAEISLPPTTFQSEFGRSSVTRHKYLEEKASCSTSRRKQTFSAIPYWGYSSSTSSSPFSVESNKSEIDIEIESTLTGISLQGSKTLEDQISCLPDEMILRILRLLPQVALGRTAQTCQKFKNLAYDESLWRRIDLKEKILSGENLNVVLSRRPVYLRLAETNVKDMSNLRYDAPQLSFLDLTSSIISNPELAQLLRACSSLTKLSLENMEIHTESILALEVSAHTIDTLNLAMCTITDDDGLALCNYLGKCERLEELNLGCIKQGWTRENFLNVINSLPRELKKLNLAGFRNTLHDDHIPLLVERCPHLTVLDMSDSSALTELALVDIVSDLTELQHLSLSRCHNIPANAIPYLVNMKSLQFLDIYTIFREDELESFQHALSGILINSAPFSSIARPTSGANPNFIWSHRLNSRK